ncbi:uncharacterized protein DUF4149 [Crenobacter luteus]|uniref:TMEM205-like domain-containing protein n=1 Tax=Crenobacter luteus TaxID=1452487 RepID=A0A165F5P2_9NEIS|nr:DUF4149 domain-containing protein [Crenobacter luteus]KZE31493.1 hypothetical protein AVW16_12025 [Crenobacter luteus]TCP11822.1 uncharacterized protein DUF4149 [Crenobacter luteus]
MNALRAVAVTFWIGGMWVIGLLVAPVLFSALERSVAGMVAGHLFAAIAWVGLVCGTLLMVGTVWQQGIKAFKGAAFWLVFGMLACTLLNHFAVTPIIAGLKTQMSQAASGAFGGGFATWHTISSLIYLVQSLMGLVYVLRVRD